MRLMPGTYRRVLVLDDTPVEVAVTQEGGAETPALRLTLNSAAKRAKRAACGARRSREDLSLELDIDPFTPLLAKIRCSGRLSDAFADCTGPALQAFSSAS